MNLVNLELSQMNEDYLKQISDLNLSLFENSNPPRFEGRPNLLFSLAEVDGKIVGFKAGYDRKPQHFYSWLGGVSETFRGQGLGRKLMELQHEALTKKGYKTVQTKTMNKFKNMLVLNLKCGFSISGTFVDEKERFMILLDKQL